MYTFSRMLVVCCCNSVKGWSNPNKDASVPADPRLKHSFSIIVGVLCQIYRQNACFFKSVTRKTTSNECCTSKSSLISVMSSTSTIYWSHKARKTKFWRFREKVVTATRYQQRRWWLNDLVKSKNGRLMPTIFRYHCVSLTEEKWSFISAYVKLTTKIKHG